MERSVCEEEGEVREQVEGEQGEWRGPSSIVTKNISKMSSLHSIQGIYEVVKIYS